MVSLSLIYRYADGVYKEIRFFMYIYIYIYIYHTSVHRHVSQLYPGLPVLLTLERDTPDTHRPRDVTREMTNTYICICICALYIERETSCCYTEREAERGIYVCYICGYTSRESTRERKRGY